MQYPIAWSNNTLRTRAYINFIFHLLFQERLSYIGPEEFVRAFIQKDTLDNEQVTSRSSSLYGKFCCFFFLPRVPENKYQTRTNQCS